MVLKRKNFIIANIWIFVSFLEYFILSTYQYSEKSLKIFVIVVIMNYILQMQFLRLIKAPIMSFFSAFLLLLYLFHFGQAVTAAYFSNLSFGLVNYITHYMTDDSVTWKALCVSLLSIGLFFSGGLLFCSSKEVIKQSQDVTDRNRSYLTCYYMGRLLFVIGTPFKLYYDFKQLIAAMSGGYAAARSVESFSGVFGVFASYMYISIPLIYLTLSSKKAKRQFLNITIAYMCLTMLTGNRGHQVVNIIAILLVSYFASDMRIKPVKVIKWLLIVFIALVFLNLIFDMRKYSISYLIDNFPALLSSALENNIVIETLHNFGATIFTPYLVISGYGTQYTPFFGETYIKSFVSVIPDLFHAFSRFNNAAIFSRMLGTNHSIGGSFIAELYYNFGGLYWIASFLFGAVYVQLSDRIISAIKCLDYKIVCLCLPFLSYSLWWVRDTVGGITRPVIWLLVIYQLIYRSPYISKKVNTLNA